MKFHLNLSISNAEKIWISEVWDYIKKTGKIPSYGTIRLGSGKLPADFQIYSIDNQLARNSDKTDITLQSIMLVEDRWDFIPVSDEIIKYLKSQVIDMNPELEIRNFSIAEIAETLNFSEKETRISFAVVALAGVGIYNGGSMARDGKYGIESFSVNPNTPYTLDFYMRFESTKRVLSQFAVDTNEQLKRDKIQILEKKGTSTPKPKSGVVIEDLFSAQRPYLILIAQQASDCYRHQLYDGFFVLIRKLIEGLMIELFEKHNIESLIKDDVGEYYGLKKIQDVFLKEKAFKLGREIKYALPTLKQIADRSAHNRYFTAKQVDVESCFHQIRLVLHELTMLNRE